MWKYHILYEIPFTENQQIIVGKHKGNINSSSSILIFLQDSANILQVIKKIQVCEHHQESGDKVGVSYRFEPCVCEHLHIFHSKISESLESSSLAWIKNFSQLWHKK